MNVRYIIITFILIIYIAYVNTQPIAKYILYPNNNRFIRSIGFHNYNHSTDVSQSFENLNEPKEEAAIIVVPRRRIKCKVGQLLDRRGKCRTPW